MSPADNAACRSIERHAFSVKDTRILSKERHAEPVDNACRSIERHANSIENAYHSIEGHALSAANACRAISIK